MDLAIILRHPEARMPWRATAMAAGYDLFAAEVNITAAYTEYDTGITIAIPQGYVGIVAPRSSISNSPDVYLANSIGVIDADYRGTIKCRFRGNVPYRVGDRIAQLMIIKHEEIIFTAFEDVVVTDRGEGGFGSSGR
jgi:dUTP pyrophosphatase